MKPSPLLFTLTLSTSALAATTCAMNGTPDDNFCILTTEGWNQAAASYIVSIDYNDNVLFDPFQHIMSSVGTAFPTLRGPAGYSLDLASLASYVPESEITAWESVLNQALSLQTEMVVTTESDASTTTTTAVPVAVTGGQTPATSTGQQTTVSSSAVASSATGLVTTVVSTTAGSSARQTGTSQQAGDNAVSTGVTHAGAVPARNAVHACSMALVGAAAAVAGFVFNL